MTNPRTITSEDLDMLRYFWTDKKDLERYCYWRDMQPALEANRPDILKAWRDYKSAEMTLSAVLGWEP